MSMISGYNSFSMGVLFSSLNQNQQRNNNGFSFMNGGMDMLGINYSDYASIRSGSYHKLLSAYYSNNASDEIKDVVSNSTSTSKDDTKTLARIEEAAGTLKGSAEALQAGGKNSLFTEVEKTDDKGVTTKDIDREAVSKALNKFVEDYNSMIDRATESNSTNILRSARTMVNYSKANERLLSKVGITIGEGNKLSVDKEALNKAKVTDLTSLFQTRGSYGSQIATQASRMDVYAKNEAAKANTYGNKGVYTYNYNTGELYNSKI